ncbi:MAG: hypothetical protein WDZ31_13040 [Phycisphaeraceae bacterium]
MATTFRTIPWWRLEYGHNMLKALPGYRGMGADRQRQAAYVLSHLLVGRTGSMTVLYLATSIPLGMLLTFGGLACCLGPLVVGPNTTPLGLVCVLPGFLMLQLPGIFAGSMAASLLGRWQYAELLRRAVEAAGGVHSCLACGYDMRMLAAADCPECGAPGYDVTTEPVPYVHAANLRRKFAHELLNSTPRYAALPAHRQRAVATALSHRLAQRPTLLVRQALSMGAIAVFMAMSMLSLPFVMDWLAPNPDPAIEFPLLLATIVAGILAWLAWDRLTLLPLLRRRNRQPIAQTLAESAARDVEPDAQAEVE